jgi:hypothetical protein
MKHILILLVAGLTLCFSNLHADTVYAFEKTGLAVSVDMYTVELYNLNFDDADTVTAEQLKKLNLRFASVGEMQAWLAKFGKGKLKTANDRLLVDTSSPTVEQQIEFHRRRRMSVASTEPQAGFMPKFLFPNDVFMRKGSMLVNILFVPDYMHLDSYIEALNADGLGYGYARMDLRDEFEFIQKNNVAIQQWLDTMSPLAIHVHAYGIIRTPNKH